MRNAKFFPPKADLRKVLKWPILKCSNPFGFFEREAIKKPSSDELRIHKKVKFEYRFNIADSRGFSTEIYISGCEVRIKTKIKFDKDGAKFYTLRKNLVRNKFLNLL